MTEPGLNGKPFYIKFSEDWVKKGDILNTTDTVSLKVLRVYRLNWWRKCLLALNRVLHVNIRVRMFEAKVISDESN
jgi:hypothetical protein